MRAYSVIKEDGYRYFFDETDKCLGSIKYSTGLFEPERILDALGYELFDSKLHILCHSIQRIAQAANISIKLDITHYEGWNALCIVLRDKMMELQQTEKDYKKLCRKVDHGCVNQSCDICDKG